MEENKNILDFEETQISKTNNEPTQAEEITAETVERKEPKRQGHSRKKKKSKIRAIVWITVLILIIVPLGFCACYAGFDYMGFCKEQGECVFMVPKGASTAQIANELKECGAVKLPLLFRAYVKVKNYDGKFTAGKHTFSKNAGYEAIARELIKPTASADTKRITIVEGWDVERIAKELENKGVCSYDDFIESVQNGVFDYDFVNQIPQSKVEYRLEGYLFPDTYEFYCGESKDSAHRAVEKMLQNLDAKLKKGKININNITISGKQYTFHEMMTMASIVEMEASCDKTEMPKVAAVFFNRLNDFSTPILGSSPTKKYLDKDPNDDIEGDPRYNTYTLSGIPAGPMCSPGIDAIKATCSPQKDFDYYYFLTDKSMKFYYSKNDGQHEALKARLKAEKNWIYE